MLAMAHDSMTYTVPDSVSVEVSDLEERHCRVTGHAVAFALQNVTDSPLRDQIAGAFMAMSGSLALHQEEYKEIIRRTAQRAYLAGKQDGIQEVGVQLGMIEKPSGGPPPTMH